MITRSFSQPSLAPGERCGQSHASLPDHFPNVHKPAETQHSRCQAPLHGALLCSTGPLGSCGWLHNLPRNGHSASTRTIAFQLAPRCNAPMPLAACAETVRDRLSVAAPSWRQAVRCTSLEPNAITLLPLQPPVYSPRRL